MPTIETKEKKQRVTVFDKPPLPRVWFVNKDGDRLIQIQRDAFICNWRKQKPEDDYPRYHSVLEKFSEQFAIFETFLIEAKLGEIYPTQYELTYVNLIPRGEGWEHFGDIGEVFPDFQRRSNSLFPPNIEEFNWQTIFSTDAGRLFVTMVAAKRISDQHPLIRFELRARGVPNENDTKWKWFDLAHETILHSFVSLTSEGIQKRIWGLSK